MDADFAPSRFMLSAQELSSGFVAAGLGVPGAPAFRALPMASHELPAALSGPDGGLNQHAALCLAVLADPLASVTLRHWPADSVHALETQIVAGGDGPVYVQFACDAGQWDLALLGNENMALAAIQRLVGPCPEAGERLSDSVSLSLPALAVLGVVAGFLREARLLAAYFAGQPRRQGVALELTPERITGALRDQAERPDLNMPFARLVLASEGALIEATDPAAVRAGFAELRDKGLLDRALLPSESAMALLNHLALGHSLTVLQAARKSGAELMLDTLVLHDGAAGRLAGGWLTDAEGRLSEIRIASPDEAAYRGLLREMLSRG